MTYRGFPIAEPVRITLRVAAHHRDESEAKDNSNEQDLPGRKPVTVRQPMCCEHLPGVLPKFSLSKVLNGEHD